MANLLIPWVRYLSDIAHKYVGYPDEEGGEDMFIAHVDNETYALDKTFNEILEAAETQSVLIIQKPDDVLLHYILLLIDEATTTLHCVGCGDDGTIYDQQFIADTADDYPVED